MRINEAKAGSIFMDKLQESGLHKSKPFQIDNRNYKNTYHDGEFELFCVDMLNKCESYDKLEKLFETTIDNIRTDTALLSDDLQSEIEKAKMTTKITTLISFIIVVALSMAIIL